VEVLSAILHRQSVRAFLDKPVSREAVQKILNTAKWAPSGVNTQPWRVLCLAGSEKQTLSQALLKQFDAKISPNPDYHYYPSEWFEPYKTRRKACGLALYSALGIKRDEDEKRRVAWRKNYAFFGAPIGLLFLIERRLEKGSWLDMGLFLQNIMLAARGCGLETCPQASLAEYPDTIRKVLNISDEWAVVCGMALGYADWDHPSNQYRTTREPEEVFVTFKGF
jgi:nitroreductase